MNRLPALALGCWSVLPLGGCAREAPPRRAEPAAPRARTEGPRWIPFAGGRPEEKGWVQVDGLLWVKDEDADPLRRGLVRDGEDLVPIAQADRREVPPDGGYVLRTDHLIVATNLPFERARTLAAVFERHVGAVLGVFGEPLDLRLPADPLRIVVAKRRAEFDRLLEAKVGHAVEWGAFYAASEGAVYASDERRAAGGLSVVADVRHELTHALLDVGRPSGRRQRMFTRPHFWAWEGAAVWAERLGDAAGSTEGAERFERFRRRREGEEVAALADVFAIPQASFQGRHYDQVASFMGWLMSADDGRLRAGFFALLARAMDGAAVPEDFERLVGIPPAAAQERWLAAIR